MLTSAPGEAWPDNRVAASDHPDGCDINVRVFDSFRGHPSGDPADVLLYCCGRAALGELPRQTQWQWDGRVRS